MRFRCLRVLFVHKDQQHVCVNRETVQSSYLHATESPIITVINHSPEVSQYKIRYHATWANLLQIILGQCLLAAICWNYGRRFSWAIRQLKVTQLPWQSLPRWANHNPNGTLFTRSMLFVVKQIDCVHAHVTVVRWCVVDAAYIQSTLKLCVVFAYMQICRVIF